MDKENVTEEIARTTLQMEASFHFELMAALKADGRSLIWLVKKAGEEYIAEQKAKQTQE